MSLSRFHGIVFDLDGTLVDSRIDFEGIRAFLGISPGESILDFVAQIPEPRRIEVEKYLIAKEIEAARTALVFGGVVEILDWLEAHSIPCAVLTRNTQSAWDITRARCGLPVFDLVLTRESGRVKPDPGAIEPILRTWEVSPQRLVHVGDFRYDLELAEATGMYSILLHPQGINPFKVGCHYVARDHLDLLNHLQQLFGTKHSKNRSL